MFGELFVEYILVISGGWYIVDIYIERYFMKVISLWGV